MARKKKNKNLQTFNVYPFLAEYGISSSYLPKAQNGNMGDSMGLEYFKNNYPGFNELSADEQNQLLNQYMSIQNDEFIPQTQMIPGLAEFSDQYNTAMQFRQDNPTTYGTNYAFSSMPTYYQGPNEGFSRVIVDEDLSNLIKTQSNASDFSSMLSGMKPGQNVFVDYKTDFSMPGGYTYDMPGKGAMSPAFQGNLNQAQIEQLIALSNQLNTPPVYPNLPSENQVFTANDLKIDEPNLGNITLTEIPENREEDENINAVSQENTITIPKRTIQNIPVNNDTSIVRTSEDQEKELSKQELRRLRRAEMFKDAYTPQTRIAEEGTETSENENQEDFLAKQKEIMEAQRKSVDLALGSPAPGFANTNLMNAFNLFSGIKNFAGAAKAGFPNMINPATGQPYKKSNFESITVTNPTGENRILNKDLLQTYIDGNEEDRKNIKQEDLWQDPNKVRMDYFNRVAGERSAAFPDMFSNLSMDLSGNISYDDVTVPNPNYDAELFEATGDAQYGPTIVEKFDMEKHGTAFDKAEQNLGDYNLYAFASDKDGNFDADNITFSRYKDGQLVTEAYDPTKNYRDHTVTTNVQEDINDQFKDEQEEERFGGTIRFQNGGNNVLPDSSVYSVTENNTNSDPSKDFFNQYLTVVHPGIDTSYQYTSQLPTGFENFFYNTEGESEIQTIKDGETTFRTPTPEEIETYRNLISERSGFMPAKFGGGLRAFLRKAQNGTPVDQNFTQIDNNNDGLPDYMDMSLQMGPFQEFDQDGNLIPDLVQPPQGNPQLDDEPFIGPINQPSSGPVTEGDEETDTDDLGIEIDKGNIGNRFNKFLKTSKFANIASEVGQLGERAIDFFQGLKNTFDERVQRQEAENEGDEVMEILPTIEASRASKGDREFRTGTFRPMSETQEEIYGASQLGGQPVSPQKGPDYSMLLQYIPTPTTVRFDEIYLQKQMQDGGQIVDVDIDTLKELMAAGADIEIL